MNKKILMGIVGVLVVLVVVVSVVMLSSPSPQSEPTLASAEMWNLTAIYPDYQTIRILPTVENLENYRIEVTLRFTTLRDGEVQESTTKSLVINAKDKQNSFAVLPYNYDLDTGYDCEIISVVKK